MFLDPIEKERMGRDQQLQYNILKIISDAYQCDIDEIRGRSRLADHIDARGIFAYILRQQCEKRLKEVGDIMDRDHTSIMNLVKRTEDLLFTKNVRCTQTVNQIKLQLFNQ